MANRVVQQHLVTKFSDGSISVEEVSTALIAPVGVDEAMVARMAYEYEAVKEVTGNAKDAMRAALAAQQGGES